MEVIEGKKYYIKEIDAKIARELIKKYHYSGKVVPNSKLHLGVFEVKTNNLMGALQYGYPMNPKATPQKLVVGATSKDMYELNRMAMTDEAPKFSESQAIGLSIKWIKRYRKDIKWLLSFSDGKEGNVGTIYQATNWIYCGYNISNSFFKLDNKIWHNIQVCHKFKEGKPEVRMMDELFKNFNNVSRISSKQHIYIFKIDKHIKLIRNIQSYPKKHNEPKITKEVIYKRDGVVLNKKEIITYSNEDI